MVSIDIRGRCPTTSQARTYHRSADSPFIPSIDPQLSPRICSPRVSKPRPKPHNLLHHHLPDL